MTFHPLKRGGPHHQIAVQAFARNREFPNSPCS
ncbi:hypothetical protein JOC55_002453 [Paenibacillus sacheonensis]|nr:hypothetical protein [Paenibacillus sacheonensis]